jgi:hypothetical protein
MRLRLAGARSVRSRSQGSRLTLELARKRVASLSCVIYKSQQTAELLSRTFRSAASSILRRPAGPWAGSRFRMLFAGTGRMDFLLKIDTCAGDLIAAFDRST